MIHLILLSGGSGSRLWPLSNSARSKQFLKVLKDEQGNTISMVQRVFGQISRVNVDLDITIATCANQENSIRSQIEGDYTLVLEPERRDTAPAIMLACASLDLQQNANPNDTVIVMPIDTFADQEYYNKISDLNEAVQTGSTDIVLLGVQPTYPSEKYGYIVPDKSAGTNLKKVSSFIEKPCEDLAEKLIEDGAMWNCGVFAFKLGFLRDLGNIYIAEKDFDSIVANYHQFPKNSFDYEVIEKSNSISVLSYEGEWKDLGTWNTLTEEMSDFMQGRAILSNSENVHVINETSLPMVVSGQKNTVVVATLDGILVCSKEDSANIKQQINEISSSRPMYEKRKWGEYRVLDSQIDLQEESVLTKELIVNAGHQMSYQCHAHRSEIWTIVAGEGEVVLGESVVSVHAGSVINIMPMQMHAARAFSDLHIIEVQLGSPLVEEDIERFGNYWN